VRQDYFAIDCSLKDLKDRVDTYFDQLEELGHTEKIQTSYYYFFGKNGDSSFVKRAGKHKQKYSLMINDYRSTVQHVVTLVTANRPAFDIRTTNTDYTSIAQAVLGEQILEYYMRENKVEKLLKRACDYAVKYSEGFIGLDWDTSMGQLVGVDEEGKPYTEGDIRYSLYSPLQVIRDVYNENSQDWVITVQKVNKYELAAKFPSQSEWILSLDNSEEKPEQRDIDYLVTKNNLKDSDVISFYTFYHKKSAALTEGKICMFVANKKLIEGPLPYDNIPMARIAPGNLDGTCLGHTGMWDLLGIQEASDKLYSALLSNNLAFATQIVRTTPDSDIEVNDLAEGIMLVESEAPLEPVNLVRSSPESYQFLSVLGGKGGELSGMNEVIKGTPGPNLRSGNALAIVAAQAITYNSDITASYNMLIEDIGTLTLRFLKEFAEHPRYASIVGKYKKAYMKEFSRKDLTNFDRVTVQQKNAVASTTAGRIQLAENLLQNGVLTKPEQYIMVMETGSLDPLIEPEIIEQMLIRAENEQLAEGKVPPAVITDTHALHIREHKAVLANIEARMNPSVVKAYTEHVQEHIDILRTVDPEVLQLSGSQPSQFNTAAPKPPVPQGGAPVLEQPGSVPAMPENMPNQPNLPQGTDQITQQSYDQLQGLQQQ